jgi:hypothetical protein
MQVRIRLFNLMRIWIRIRFLLLIKVTATAAGVPVQTLEDSILSIYAFIVSVHGHP